MSGTGSGTVAGQLRDKCPGNPSTSGTGQGHPLGCPAVPCPVVVGCDGTDELW